MLTMRKLAVILVLASVSMVARIGTRRQAGASWAQLAGFLTPSHLFYQLRDTTAGKNDMS